MDKSGLTSPTPPSPSPAVSSVMEAVGAQPGGTIPATNAVASTFGYASAFTAGAGGAGGGATTSIADNVGYIDSAIVRSRIRVRFDANYDDTSPDKAEFFYAKCGCFASPQAGSLFDPRARGPVHVSGSSPLSKFMGQASINYQEVATYLEYAPTQRFSGFIELPARFIQPTLGSGTSGFSDLNIGVKYALIANPNQYYTFQFRTYVPTGDSYVGLGTGHASLEPALLVFQRLSDRLFFSGEFRDWIPVGGSDFAGNVLRYGVGLTYNIVLTDHLRIAPVNEIVGWSILNGQEFIPDKFSSTYGQVKTVGGQTIVNEKIGLRIGLGDYSQAGGGSGLNDRHSIYVGYGTALTGDHWYKNTFRLEYNFWF